MRFSTTQMLIPLLGLLQSAGCGGAPAPTACAMNCMAMSTDSTSQVCGTDSKTYSKCDWDCGTVPMGVSIFPGACVNGAPPADAPPTPADGVKICDWIKVGTQWVATECASQLKAVTGDTPQTLDGQSAQGSIGMQMPLPVGMQPDSVDHRMRFGPAKNQGTAGTCTAFGAIATVEGMIRSQLSTPITLSEMHLWSHYRSPGSDASAQAVKRGGVATSDAATAAGLPYDDMLAKDWELDASMMSKKTPDPALIANLDGQAQYQVASVDVLAGTVANGRGDMVPSVDALKTTLAEGRDITIAMFTSDQEWSNPPGGVLPDWTFITTGGHAVSLVGYRTMGGKFQFLMRNSWGPTWASSGYAWIGSDTLQKNLLHAFTVSVKRVGIDTAPTCPTGQAADLSGTCRMVCADGSIADSTNTCRMQMTTCPAGQVLDGAGSCVAACAAGMTAGTGYTATCTDRGCTWHVNDGVQGCAAGAGMTCDKFCPAPTCQVTTTKNEMGKPIWGCTGHMQ